MSKTASDHILLTSLWSLARFLCRSMQVLFGCIKFDGNLNTKILFIYKSLLSDAKKKYKKSVDYQEHSSCFKFGM